MIAGSGATIRTTLVAEQLADDFEGKVAREEVEHAVEAHADDFADARVTNFVPTLLARRAREELENLTHEQPSTPESVRRAWQDRDFSPDGDEDRPA